MKFLKYPLVGLLLGVFVINCAARDVTQDTVRLRFNTVLSFDNTVRLVAEDGSWTNTPTQLGYLKSLTSDVQTQLNAKTGTNALPTGWTQKTNTIVYVSGEALDTNTLILTQTLATNTVIYIGK